MRKLIGLLSVAVLVVISIPSVAFAAKPTAPGGGGSPKPTPTVEYKGYDVSYPQCGKSLPNDHYFGIVGVNGGNAATPNPCLADQLVWQNNAKTSTVNQPRLQLYVNTANPAQDTSYGWTSWPTTPYDSNGNRPTNPYGECTGNRNNNEACSWLYGWNRSIYTEGVFQTAANSKGLSSNTADYTWWLDVETMNSWQSGSNDALIKNTAAIEGFGAYYKSKGAKIGLYSTEVQWTQITGNNIGSGSILNGLPNWRPSGKSLANAKSNCTVAPLTAGGYISLTQYIVKGLDNNHSCI